MQQKTQIRFWPSTSLPMYGTSVEELHLDINGSRYAVRVEDGEPVLVDVEYESTQAGAMLSEADEIVEPGDYHGTHDRTDERDGLR